MPSKGAHGSPLWGAAQQLGRRGPWWLFRDRRAPVVSERFSDMRALPAGSVAGNEYFERISPDSRPHEFRNALELANTHCALLVPCLRARSFQHFDDLDAWRLVHCSCLIVT